MCIRPPSQAVSDTLSVHTIPLLDIQADPDLDLTGWYRKLRQA